MDYAIRDMPFTEIEAKVFVGEDIEQGLMVAFHPKDGMLYPVWRGATVAGVAVEDLKAGGIAVFNPAVGHFRNQPGPKVVKCEVCQDGDVLPAHTFECPACGEDWLPF